ncbi:MAG: NAD(P)H-dependent oxidoreductase [Promethearchaeota archaeon]
MGHPRPGSLNHAVAGTVVNTLVDLGWEVTFHDLYAEGFDPKLGPGELARGGTIPGTLEGHCRELSSADGIVVVHPNWWGQPPAVLKGWIDRVFRPGVAYRFREGDAGGGAPDGLLAAKVVLVLTTSDTPARGSWSTSATPWTCSGRGASSATAGWPGSSAPISRSWQRARPKSAPGGSARWPSSSGNFSVVGMQKDLEDSHRGILKCGGSAQVRPQLHKELSSLEKRRCLSLLPQAS